MTGSLSASYGLSHLRIELTSILQVCTHWHHVIKLSGVFVAEGALRSHSPTELFVSLRWRKAVAEDCSLTRHVGYHRAGLALSAV